MPEPKKNNPFASLDITGQLGKLLPNGKKQPFRVTDSKGTAGYKTAKELGVDTGEAMNESYDAYAPAEKN